MKLYIDDQRDAPEGWHLIRNKEELEKFVNNHGLASIEQIDLDGYLERCTGIDIIHYLYQSRYNGNKKLPLPKMTFHSSDECMNQKMQEICERVR
jgi:hypothetical protein